VQLLTGLAACVLLCAGAEAWVLSGNPEMSRNHVRSTAKLFVMRGCFLLLVCRC
jgi:hypothetical protein